MQCAGTQAQMFNPSIPEENVKQKQTFCIKDQGTVAVHHSSTTAKSGNQPEIGLSSISGDFFGYFFFAKKVSRERNAPNHPVLLEIQLSERN